MEDSPMQSLAPVARRFAPYLVAVVVGGAGIGYAVHEHHNAQDLAAQNAQVTAQLNVTHAQLDTLAAKVNALAANSEATAAPSPAPMVAPKPRAAAHRPSAQDLRFKKLQSQIDEQGKAIEAARSDLASTRTDLASTRTELTGSIAKTHDELVVLEKKGQRNYFEFDLQKSKEFKRSGPLSLSLRKANTKHGYADLALMVDDRNMSQKHVNLYQPVMFYQPDSGLPMEIVINEISKDHIHGYVSAPKYRTSELTAAAAPDPDANPVQGPDQSANPTSQPPTRKKLPPPSPEPNN